MKFNQSVSIKLLRFLLQKFIFTAFYSLVLFRANDGSLAMDGCSDRCPEQPGLNGGREKWSSEET